MGINGGPPHTPAHHEKPLGFRHNPWKSRLDILEDMLAKYKQGDCLITPGTLYYIPDLARFEEEFVEAHLPWQSSGKILCERCDREWTATWRAQQNGQTTPGMTSHWPPALPKAAVAPRATRNAAQDEQVGEHIDDIDRFETAGHPKGQGLVGEFVDDVEHAEFASRYGVLNQPT
jgi:hypothetical protein